MCLCVCLWGGSCLPVFVSFGPPGLKGALWLWQSQLTVSDTGSKGKLDPRGSKALWKESVGVQRCGPQRRERKRQRVRVDGMWCRVRKCEKPPFPLISRFCHTLGARAHVQSFLNFSERKDAFLCSVYTSVYTREVRGCLCLWTGNFKGLHSLLLMAYKSNPSMCDKTFLNCFKKKMLQQ